VLVRYVDDDAAGAVVEPKTRTTTSFEGPPSSLVGFTENDAKAGVPDGYVFVSLDNVLNFDNDTSVDQVITVHLARIQTPTTPSVAPTPAPSVKPVLASTGVGPGFSQLVVGVVCCLILGSALLAQSQRQQRRHKLI
jgi:hypothetical protein